MEVGAEGNAAGFFVTTTVGFGLGALSADDGPTWKDGAFVFHNDWDGAVSLGGVVLGDEETLKSPAYYIDERGIKTPTPSILHPGQQATILEHELGHIPQATFMGIGYAPVSGFSLGVGGAVWATQNGIGQGIAAGAHIYDPIESGSLHAVPSSR
jgi:hypothetical protein